MSLREPTDQLILEFFAREGRNNAINAAAELGINRPLVSVRLAILAQNDYLERVGPASNSGLYELTDTGNQLLDCEN